MAHHTFFFSHAAMSITGVAQWAGRCKASNAQQWWSNWEEMVMTDTRIRVYWHHRDLHICNCCSSFFSYLCSSPLRTSCLSQNPLSMSVHEVDITPPYCYDIDQPHPSPLFLSLASLHSPLHWFLLSPLSPPARSDYTRCSHTVIQAQTNTYIRVFGRDEGMCSLALV